jgi:hypothetical protein
MSDDGYNDDEAKELNNIIKAGAQVMSHWHCNEGQDDDLYWFPSFSGPKNSLGAASNHLGHPNPRVIHRSACPEHPWVNRVQD